MKPFPAQIATEIRAELRSILKLRRNLYTPIQRFDPITGSDGATRYYVQFDMHTHKRFTDPVFRCGEWKMPDERIQNEVLSLAEAIWHLKDRLRQFANS
ncbi:MAG TPA: hypothetical protein VGM76_05150, partial [Lacipirellulaceae bacterium]